VYKQYNKFIWKCVFDFSCVAAKQRRSGRYCPPMGYREKYEVAFVDNGPPMYGCAYLDHDWQLSVVPLLHLWLERREEASIEPAYCKNMSSTYNESLLLYSIAMRGDSVKCTAPLDPKSCSWS